MSLDEVAQEANEPDTVEQFFTITHIAAEAVENTGIVAECEAVVEECADVFLSITSVLW